MFINFTDSIRTKQKKNLAATIKCQNGAWRLHKIKISGRRITGEAFLIDEMKIQVCMEKKLIRCITKSVSWIAHTTIRILTHRLNGPG